jgi:hypothetical protein
LAYIGLFTDYRPNIVLGKILISVSVADMSILMGIGRNIGQEHKSVLVLVLAGPISVYPYTSNIKRYEPSYPTLPSLPDLTSVQANLISLHHNDNKTPKICESRNCAVTNGDKYLVISFIWKVRSGQITIY